MSQWLFVCGSVRIQTLSKKQPYLGEIFDHFSDEIQESDQIDLTKLTPYSAEGVISYQSFIERKDNPYTNWIIAFGGSLRHETMQKSEEVIEWLNRYLKPSEITQGVIQFEWVSCDTMVNNIYSFCCDKHEWHSTCVVINDKPI